MKKPKGLSPLFAAHAHYKATLKQYRTLRKDLAAYIAAALPERIGVQWTQGTAFNDTSTRFEVGFVLVYEYQGGPEARYYLDDGAKAYRNEVPNLTKAHLQKLIKIWEGIPHDILDAAFGDAVVRIQASGKFDVEET